MGQAAANSRVDDTEASHHCFNNKLAGKLLHAVHIFSYISTERQLETTLMLTFQVKGLCNIIHQYFREMGHTLCRPCYNGTQYHYKSCWHYVTFTTEMLRMHIWADNPSARFLKADHTACKWAVKSAKGSTDPAIKKCRVTAFIIQYFAPQLLCYSRPGVIYCLL